jgi:hypothetical protein
MASSKAMHRATLESDAIKLADIPAWVEAIRSTGEALLDLDNPISAATEFRMDVTDEARKPLFAFASSRKLTTSQGATVLSWIALDFCSAPPRGKSAGIFS